MRDRGVPLLAIPGNYYDDLAARTELEPAMIERMRELGVLYEAGERGELLHFYTAMAGPDVLRGPRAPRRLRRLRRVELAGPHAAQRGGVWESSARGNKRTSSYINLGEDTWTRTVTRRSWSA